jgi:metallophosphoesterase (TIGR00282 family)
MRILFIGDVMGKPGRRLVRDLLPVLRREEGPFDFVVANGENAAAGFGLTGGTLRELLDSGVDVLTGGNHIFDKKEFLPLLDSEPLVLRPANYPAEVPGRGVGIFRKNDRALAVLNLQGRAFMPPIDCPFRTADALLSEIDVNCVLVDVHAEASSEKRALALYLDGRVSAVIGTHTHVQTADEDVLPGGTATLTDAGMTGGHGGVIGMTLESVLPRMKTGVPSKFDVCETDPRLEGVILDVDDETGRALSIRRLSSRPRESV